MLKYQSYIKENKVELQVGDTVRYVSMNGPKLLIELIGKVTDKIPLNASKPISINFVGKREVTVPRSDVHQIMPNNSKLYDFDVENITTELQNRKFKLGDLVEVKTDSTGFVIFNGLKANIESLHPYNKFNGAYDYTILFTGFKGRIRVSQWDLLPLQPKKDEQNTMDEHKFKKGESARYIDKNENYPEFDKHIGIIKTCFPKMTGFADHEFEYTLQFPDDIKSSLIVMESELEKVSSEQAKNAERGNFLLNKINDVIHRNSGDSLTPRQTSNNQGPVDAGHLNTRRKNHSNQTTINFNPDETPIDKNQTAQYIEHQFSNKNKNIKVGDKVLVDGTDEDINRPAEKIVYDECTGTVKRINDKDYFIEFDEDDSKNRMSYHALVPKEIVTLSQGVKKNMFELAQKVVCVDMTSGYYKKTGIIVKRWDEDNTYMVKFGEDEVWLTFDEIKNPKDVSTTVEAPAEKRQIGFHVAPRNEPKKIVIEEEEEEEEEGDIIKNLKKAEPFKKDDLLEFSYEDFFEDADKISTIEDIKTLKAKYEELLKQPNLTKIKMLFAERALRNFEIVESYFDFLIHKVAKDLPVLRTSDLIDNADLLSTKTKVRASDSKELTSKYSFDQGIIAYWKFKNAVVFKTL